MIPLPPQVNHVLYAVLDWGLGHATRSIPIIHFLLSKNIKVTIASDGEALIYLQREFPSLTYEELQSYDVRYTSQTLTGIVIRNIPNVYSAIRAESKQAKVLTQKHKPDLIISDSRFGFRSKKVPSYFISHQLKLYSKNPLLSSLMNVPNTFFINSFDLCLIPDNQNGTLSGKLSQNEKIKRKKWIGPLSRFKKKESLKKNYLAIVLSGPEPARTKLETKLLSLVSDRTEKIIIIRGNSKAPLIAINKPNLELVDSAGSEELNDVLLSSDYIICRSGYTSIMDLQSLDKGAFLIPTPGQTEQEYLARYLDGKYGFKCVPQESLDAMYKALFDV